MGKQHPGLVHTLGFRAEGKRTRRLKSSMEGLELEEVDKVLWRDGHEAAVWVVGCARMATVLEHSQQQHC